MIIWAIDTKKISININNKCEKIESDPEEEEEEREEITEQVIDRRKTNSQLEEQNKHLMWQLDWVCDAFWFERTEDGTLMYNPKMLEEMQKAGLKFKKKNHLL